MSRVSDVIGKSKASPPKWLPDGLIYETIMGSMAYGVSSDASDMDIYGVCVPPKDYVFPHLRGEIAGFGKPGPSFDQWQEHHIEVAGSPSTYDFSIYGIVRYFQLLMDNNPNIVDSIFTPQSCVTHVTPVGQVIRDNRTLFLHKGAWHKYKGYAYSQVHKMKIRNPEPGSKRDELIKQFGFDVKFAYHVVRLINEVEQILTTGDLDIQQDRERLKSIRRGEWTMEQVEEFFTSKEKSLEALYTSSTLRHSPSEAEIKPLLLNCLEAQYGSLGAVVSTPSKERELLLSIKEMVGKYS